MSSYIRLALVRTGALSETLAKASIHSPLMVPGSWISVLPASATDCMYCFTAL